MFFLESTSACMHARARTHTHTHTQNPSIMSGLIVSAKLSRAISLYCKGYFLRGSILRNNKEKEIAEESQVTGVSKLM